MKKVYLAIPYSGIEEESFRIANEVAAELMKQGYMVYSPITHNHPIAIAHGLPTGYDFWEKFDTVFVQWSDIVVVIDLGERLNNQPNGYDLILLSKGVQAELKIAAENNKELYTYYYSTKLLSKKP